MAGVGANSNSGIGSGEAQIYNTSGSVNQFQRVLAQQQAKRAAEQKELQDYLGKVKMDGLRDPDRLEFFSKYNKWKDSSIKSWGEKDNFKKSLAKSEADKQLMELNAFVQNSKKAGEDDDKFAITLQNEKDRNQYTDDAVKLAQRNRSLPITDKNYIFDKSTLERQIDFSKINDKFNVEDHKLLESARYSNPIEEKIQHGNRTGVRILETKYVDPQKQNDSYLALSNDRDVKAYLQKKYVDLYDQYGEEDATRQAILLEAKQRGQLSHQNDPKYTYDRDPGNWKEKLLFAHSLKGADKELPPVTIGNIEGFVPTIKQSGDIVKEKSSNLFTQNFNNEKVTIKPGKVTDPMTGHSEVNTEPFDINVGSVSMVPVFKDLANNDPRNGSELSYRQLEEILLGKHKSFKSGNVTFKPIVYGTRVVKNSDGNSITKGVSVSYDAVKGNKNVPTQNFDKTVQQFQEATNSKEFRSLSAKQRLDWIKQNFNLK